MKERPILFKSDMVRAILEGKKTQTRRVIKPQPCIIKCTSSTGCSIRWEYKKGTTLVDMSLLFSEIINALVWRCPYGQVGDRLWVRERHCIECYKNDGVKDPCHYFDEDPPYEINDCEIAKWCSPIFMPRWASRILLEITGIRVERMKEISNEDIWAEGILDSEVAGGDDYHFESWVKPLKRLWDSINAKRGYSWESNPFVWIIEFKRIEEVNNV